MRSRQAMLATSLLLVAGIAFAPIAASEAKTDAKSAPSAAQCQDDPVVLLQTTKGPIKIKVFKKEAPITSNNFLDLVQRKFYDGLTFHRYVDGFVIQGGDPLGTGGGNFVDPKTHKERHIKLEQVPTLLHDAPGTVAMARTDDPNSASCQFYITLSPQPGLDHPPTGGPGYAVFGRVIEGMENVKKLRKGDKMTKVTVVAP